MKCWTTLKHSFYGNQQRCKFALWCTIIVYIFDRYDKNIPTDTCTWRLSRTFFYPRPFLQPVLSWGKQYTCGYLARNFVPRNFVHSRKSKWLSISVARKSMVVIRSDVTICREFHIRRQTVPLKTSNVKEHLVEATLRQAPVPTRLLAFGFRIQ